MASDVVKTTILLMKINNSADENENIFFQCWNRVLGSIPSETVLSSYLYSENPLTWKDPLSTIDSR